jgi:hypothetical protein
MPEETKETQNVVAAPTAAPGAVNTDDSVNRLAMMPMMTMMPLIPVITWVPIYTGFNTNLYDPVSQVKQIVREVMSEKGMVKDSSITKK